MKTRKSKNELESLGKRRTILVSISILLVSIHTIYFYHSVKPEIDGNKLIQQIVRFGLTGLLLAYAYQGKKWARGVLVVLFTFATIIAIKSLVTINSIFVLKLPFIVMVFVYSFSVYHFMFAKSYKAFVKFQIENKSTSYSE